MRVNICLQLELWKTKRGCQLFSNFAVRDKARGDTGKRGRAKGGPRLWTWGAIAADKIQASGLTMVRWWRRPGWKVQPKLSCFAVVLIFNLTNENRSKQQESQGVVQIPGWQGCHLTMFAAINQQGVFHHHSTIGPYYYCPSHYFCGHTTQHPLSRSPGVLSSGPSKIPLGCWASAA